MVTSLTIEIPRIDEVATVVDVSIGEMKRKCPSQRVKLQKNPQLLELMLTWPNPEKEGLQTLLSRKLL